MYKLKFLQGIELFLRSEFTLHLLLMFLLESLFVYFFNINLWAYLLPFIVGIAKELTDILLKGGRFDFTDFAGTIIGGYLTIIL